MIGRDSDQHDARISLPNERTSLGDGGSKFRKKRASLEDERYVIRPPMIPRSYEYGVLER